VRTLSIFRIDSVLALLCLVFGSWAFAAEEVQVKTASGPEIRFEAESLELGEAVRGELLEATFIYHNAGDQELKILKAKPG
jgi:hypothetical protein